MAERRDLLKFVSAVPLGMLATAAAAQPEDPQGETADAATTTSTTGQPAAPRVKEPLTAAPSIRDYANYHLLGQPEAGGNLLGTHRPADWRSTKAALRQALHAAASPPDPIHDWLATFNSSFDERSTNIIVGAKTALYGAPGATNPRYEPQLYDATLRGASALLDRCLRYRNDMGQFEISGVTAGLSYLTFIKTKPLQRNYIENSNNSDLAALEHDTDTQAADELARIWGLLRLFDSHQLKAKQIELAGSAAGESLEGKKSDFLTGVLVKQFNIQSENQLAQFTRLLSPGSASNYAERYLRLLAMLVEDLTDAYSKLFSAAVGVQTVMGLTHVAIGQSPLVAVAIPAFSSVAEVQAWVGQVVPHAGAQRKPDVLDAMVLWCRAVMRTLDTQSQFETEFTVSVPLNQPWGNPAAALVTPAQMTAAFANGGFGPVSFTLPAAAIPIAGTLRFPRLVGIGVTVEFTQDDQSPLQYTPGFPGSTSGQPPPQPQVDAARTYEANKLSRLNATLTSPPQPLPVGGSYSRPKLFIPNVRIQGGSGGDFEPTLSYDLGCRGLNPFGAWTITFDRNVLEFFPSASPLTAAKVMGIVLHLRLRGAVT